MKESDVRRAIRLTTTDHELYSRTCPLSPKLTESETREIAALLEVVDPAKKRKTFVDRYDDYFDLIRILVRWAKSEHSDMTVSKIGYKRECNFARNIPSTANDTSIALSDDTADEVNRAVLKYSKIRPRNVNIFTVYFRMNKPSYPRTATICKTTAYNVKAVIPESLHYLNNEIDWRLI